MGLEPKEEKERNQAIYNDYKSGASYVDMVSKYRISSQRIWQIIKKQEKKSEVLDIAEGVK